MAGINNGGPLAFDATIDETDFKGQIDDMRRRIVGLSDRTERESQRMDRAFKSLAIGVGSAFTLRTAERFIGQMVRVRGEFQQLEIAFTTMLKSKDAADKLMSQVKELAATTPFELSDVAQGTKQLLAYGFAADDVVKTVRMLGDVAAGVSAPLGDIVYLYGTLRTQGRAFTQDIRQFTNRGIPIVQALADQFHVAQSEVLEMVSAGKVGFPEVEKAIQSMTSQSGQFFNLMAAQSKSLTGQISNLRDSFDSMLNDLGTSAQGIVAGSISAVGALVDNYREILDILGILVGAYGTYKAAVIATVVAERAHEAMMLEVKLAQQELTVNQALSAAATKSLAAAWRSLTAAMAANPLGAIAVAITGILVGLRAVLPELQSTESIISDISDASAKVGDTASDLTPLIDRYQELADNTHRNAQENEELAKTIEKLTQAVPNAIAQVDQYGKVLSLNIPAIQGFNEAIKKSNELVLQQAVATGQQRLRELSQQIAHFQQIINKGVVSSTQFNPNAGPTGARITLTRTASQREVAEAATQVQALGKEYSDLQKKVTDAQDALRGGVKAPDAKEAARDTTTVAEKVADLNKQLKEQQVLLSKLRSPGSIVDEDAITKATEKIKELKKELETLQGKPGKAAPIAPDLSQFDDLGTTLRNTLIKSLKDVKQNLSDEAGDVMDAITDKWNQGVADIARFTAPNPASARASLESFFKNVFDDPFNDTIAVIRRKISEIDDILATGIFVDGFGNKIALTPAQIESLKRAKEQLVQLAVSGDALWQSMRELPAIFSDLGRSVGRMNEDLAKVLNTMGDVLNRAIDFRNSVKEAQEGLTRTASGGFTNLIQGISGALGAVGAVAGAVTGIIGSIMDAQAERQRRAEQARIDAINLQNERLREQLDLLDQIAGVDRIQAYAQAAEDLNKSIQSNSQAIVDGLTSPIKQMFVRLNGQTDELNALLKAQAEGDTKAFIEHGENLERFMSDAGKAALDSIKEADDQLRKLGQDTREYFTGTTLKGLTDDIVDMFNQGKISAQDFADSFQKTMQDAIVATFKRQFLEKQLEGWYDEFAKLSESGGGLTKEEIAQLQAAYNAILSGANAGLENLQKVTGVKIGPTGTPTQEPTGLEGAVKGITAEQAGLIAGQFNAMRISQADLLQATRQQLLSLSAIEANTRYNKHLEHLVTIDSKLDALKADPLRATGSIA